MASEQHGQPMSQDLIIVSSKHTQRKGRPKNGQHSKMSKFKVRQYLDFGFKDTWEPAAEIIALYPSIVHDYYREHPEDERPEWYRPECQTFRLANESVLSPLNTQPLGFEACLHEYQAASLDISKDATAPNTAHAKRPTRRRKGSTTQTRAKTVHSNPKSSPAVPVHNKRTNTSELYRHIHESGPTQYTLQDREWTCPETNQIYTADQSVPQTSLTERFNSSQQASCLTPFPALLSARDCTTHSSAMPLQALQYHPGEVYHDIEPSQYPANTPDTFYPPHCQPLDFFAQSLWYPAHEYFDTVSYEPIRMNPGLQYMEQPRDR